VVVFEQTGDFSKASVPDTANEEAGFILFAGKPLDQKIVHYGSFVLSSEEEVYKAMADFRMGKNGFERALTWKSDLQRRLDYS
jgi:redox-sensitive bicupin YhaK (pirin superfamily)